VLTSELKRIAVVEWVRKLVLTIHDLIPIVYPAPYKRRYKNTDGSSDAELLGKCDLPSRGSQASGAIIVVNHRILFDAWRDQPTLFRKVWCSSDGPFTATRCKTSGTSLVPHWPRGTLSAP
jgi:hypothetical protein